MISKTPSDTTRHGLVSWGDYLAGRNVVGLSRECRRNYGAAFTKQRNLLHRMVERMQPKVAACLGAGVLNDIPYRPLLRNCATLHLVDWIPEIVETGVAMSIIGTDEAGRPECAYCIIGTDMAKKCCRNFHCAEPPQGGVCGHFVPEASDQPVCRAFELGDWPLIHVQDATGGYASAFAMGLNEGLRGVSSWKQAFARAIRLAQKAQKTERLGLDIPDSSVDLVTSSMLISQFESEPYDYFAKQVARLLGPPSATAGRYLEPAMKHLRDLLVTHQIEQHCAEIERILAPGGRVFMSFELFHVNPETDAWFLVKETHGALKLLDERFSFNFDIVSEEECMGRFAGREHASVVISLVLEAKRQGRH